MTTTLQTSKQLDEAAAEFQESLGEADAEITTANGSVQVKGPAATLDAMADLAMEVDPGTDPWPNDEDGEPVEYVQAIQAHTVGAGLINSLARLKHLRKYEIHYLFRRKDSWTSQGKTVHGQMKRPTGLLKNYAEADFIVLLNWDSWQAFNAMQRVALVYHELRHGDADGKINPHDFEGFFDELQLFGTGTYRDWNSLARAAERGSDVRHQYTLSLLDEAN